MKKITLSILTFIIILTLFSCTNSSSSNSQNPFKVGESYRYTSSDGSYSTEITVKEVNGNWIKAIKKKNNKIININTNLIPSYTHK